MKKLLLIYLFSPVLLVAQRNHKEIIENYMKAEEKVNAFSGTVLVSSSDKVIYSKAFGLADRELSVKNALQTKFQIGSLTKQFTACCILQLAEKGKLSLEDKLSLYFPEFPKADSVTIHMLLSHTSGIKNYTNLPEFGVLMALQLSKDSIVALIKKQSYDFSPGAKWAYSNSGYFLLGYIIEKVSAESYSEYVQNNVISKAGLKNTFVNRWDSILTNRAKGYYRTSTGWHNSSFVSMEFSYSASSIISTAEDLFKWNRALFGGKIISPSSFKKMINPNFEHYGYGIVTDTFRQHLRTWHRGHMPGFASYLCNFPIDSVVIVVLSNNESNSPRIANALAAIIFDIPVATSYIHTEVKLNPNVFDKYVGKYILASGDEIEIAKKGDKLYDIVSDIELKAESKVKFFYTDGSDRQIEFAKDKFGKIKNIVFIDEGIKELMKRL